MCWWIVGAGLITQAGGISGSSLNVYYGTWLNVVIVFLALNSWFLSRGALSAKDFMNTSPTLVCWYALLASSLVVMGSASNEYSYFDIAPNDGPNKGDYILAIR